MTRSYARRRTPYDTGRRLEPLPWVHGNTTGQERPRRAKDDDYGRVDFDNEEGTTLVTLHITRDDTGTHHLHIAADPDLPLQIHHQG